MRGLKEMLLCEQRRLEEVLAKAREMEQNVPPGSLRISGSKNWVQFYHCMPGDKTKGSYIPKENQELIRRLAQKSYNAKIIRLASRRLTQIKKITRDYEDDELEMVYLKEHKERKKRIQPVEPVWEHQTEEWVKQEYRGKEFREDVPRDSDRTGRKSTVKIRKDSGRLFLQKADTL